MTGDPVRYACPLCGRRFDATEAARGCAACGKDGCGLVRCPGCGYEFPRDEHAGPKDGIIAGLKKLLGGG